MGDSQASEKKGGSRKSPFRDARGAVAVYVAIVAPMLFGIGALTLDVGRLITLHTELQAAADGASIAGARELDRLPGSIEKAKEAAAEALANIQTFATGTKQAIFDTTTLKTDCTLTPAPGVPCIRFLRSLPEDLFDSADPPNLIARGDDRPITGTEYIDPAVGSQGERDEEARFIDVHIEARDVTNFLVRLLAAFGQDPLLTSSTSATAIAGQDKAVCDVPAMWMCNPNEDPATLEADPMAGGVDMDVLAGRQLLMFLQASAGTHLPGDWGLLCPNGNDSDPNCGGSETKVHLASAGGNCVSLENSTTKPGVTLSAVVTGINVRLDRYSSNAKTSGVPWLGNSDYLPAANVTQGGEKDDKGPKAKCGYDAIDPIGPPPGEEVAMALPDDSCFGPPNTCGTVAGNVNGNDRIGNKIWDYPEYFRINHGCDVFNDASCNLSDPAYPENQGNCCKPADWNGVTGAGWPPTRFATYRYEIEKNHIPGTGFPPPPIYDKETGVPIEFPPGTPITTAEDGRPECYEGGQTPGDPPYQYDFFPGGLLDELLFKDRRVFPVAVVNCVALKNSGAKAKGRFSFTPPEMAYIFITRPIEPPSAGKIQLFAEVLGNVDLDETNNHVRDIVQIYRRGR